MRAWRAELRAGARSSPSGRPRDCSVSVPPDAGQSRETVGTDETSLSRSERVPGASPQVGKRLLTEPGLQARSPAARTPDLLRSSIQDRPGHIGGTSTTARNALVQRGTARPLASGPRGGVGKNAVARGHLGASPRTAGPGIPGAAITGWRAGAEA